MSEADPVDPVLFATRLHPHRSLTQSQFRWLLTGVAAVSTVATLPFVIMGAWPVAGFMGLDVLAVYVAFKASFRAARAYEDVEVTTIQLTLAKVNPRGATGPRGVRHPAPRPRGAGGPDRGRVLPGAGRQGAVRRRPWPRPGGSAAWIPL